MAALSSVTSEQAVYRSRRTTELVLLLIAQGIGFSGYALTHLDIDGHLPGSWPYVLGVWLVLGIGMHVVVRLRLPYADPVLLPATFLLVGLGVAMIHRIDLISEPPRADAQTQLLWVVLGIGGAIAAILLVKDYRVLRRFPYVLFLTGLVLLLLPLTPLGVELNGSRIWIRVLGYSFQPAEVAKIVLSFAFAGYLADTKDVLAMAGPKVLGLTLPRARDLGPILVMWLASLLVLIYQKDLGTSMLFFGLFVAMVYVATGRSSWVLLGGVLFAAGGWFAYQRFAYVGVRVSSWLAPFSDYDKNYQVIQGQFGFAWGGLLGRGWGLGRPGLTPLAKSDFITAAIGEELGVVGLMAVILVYGLIVARGLRTALSCSEPFGKLLSAGLSLVFALQVFAIIGGVTRLLPLTGLTTPFMSQGGSSMVANWLVMAVMLLVSHDARKPVPVAVGGPDVASLDADATQVIAVPRSTHPAPRPEPRTASSAVSPDEVEATEVGAVNRVPEEQRDGVPLRLENRVPEEQRDGVPLRLENRVPEEQRDGVPLRLENRVPEEQRDGVPLRLEGPTSDPEATAALSNGEEAVDTVERPRTAPEEPTQVYRLDEEDE